MSGVVNSVRSLIQGMVHRKLQILLLVALVLLGGLAFALAGYLGIRHGVEARMRAIEKQSWEHYNKGELYLQEGNIELAMAEFEEALRLNPNNKDALEKLRKLQAMKKQTPPPTAPALEKALDGMLEEARKLYDQGKWEEAITALENLRALAPDFEKTTISELLFSAYFEAGKQKAAQDDMELAVRYFNKALEIIPDEPRVKAEKEKASLYIEALSYWGADWDKTLATLQKLYEMDPDYKDVAEKIRQAHLEYAEVLAYLGRWCDAEAQYRIAAQSGADAKVKASLNKAHYLCHVATPTPSATAEIAAAGTVTPTGSTTSTTSAKLLPHVPGTCPSGGRIAWADYDAARGIYIIYVYDATTGQVKKLAEEASNPSFSPDGKTLLFRSWRGDMIGLARMPASGGEWARVTKYAEDTFPAWSPDGERMAFASRREGDRKWRIYLGWPLAEENVSELYFGTRPAWSPDGSYIAFQGCDRTGSHCGLYSIEAAGGNLRGLTDKVGDTAPSWSPDGSKIAFMSADRDGNWEIYVLELEAGREIRLTDNPDIDGLPVWSPDGRCLAFLSHRDGKWGVYVMKADGSSPSLIASLQGSLPNWMDHNLSWGR